MSRTILRGIQVTSGVCALAGGLSLRDNLALGVAFIALGTAIMALGYLYLALGELSKNPEL